MRFPPAVEFRRRGRRGPHFAVERRRLAFLHEATANAINGVHVDAQRFADLRPRPLAAGPMVIAQEQHARVLNRARRRAAVTGDFLQTLPLRRRQHHWITIGNGRCHAASLPKAFDDLPSSLLYVGLLIWNC